jgi:hypothetical protein
VCLCIESLLKKKRYTPTIRSSKRSSVYLTDENRPKMKSSVQIIMFAIGEWNFKCFLWIAVDLRVIAAILLLICGTLGQRPSCWEYYKEDPETIDQVYFPHESNCRFYYQCSTHGVVRMKCQHGMLFDADTHQVHFHCNILLFEIANSIFFTVWTTWWSQLLIFIPFLYFPSYCCHFLNTLGEACSLI